ncbi:unnamed protein product [Ilex paraguariensis]|uniref:Uncharacterized protein n=1 Tax=Ilex paraguariensis TaxID=185542 RepID=A0ABC8SDR2_9AQUA
MDAIQVPCTQRRIANLDEVLRLVFAEVNGVELSQLKFGLGPAPILTSVAAVEVSFATIPDGELDESATSRKRLHRPSAAPGPSNARVGSLAEGAGEGTEEEKAQILRSGLLVRPPPTTWSVMARH